jgi:hypothetical protein
MVSRGATMGFNWRKLAEAMFDIPPDASAAQRAEWERQARKEVKKAEKKINPKKPKKS